MSEASRPQLGLDVGVEMLSVDDARSQTGVFAASKTAYGYRGFEFVGVQGGIDLRVAPAFHVGPFAH